MNHHDLWASGIRDLLRTSCLLIKDVEVRCDRGRWTAAATLDPEMTALLDGDHARIRGTLEAARRQANATLGADQQLAAITVVAAQGVTAIRASRRRSSQRELVVASLARGL